MQNVAKNMATSPTVQQAVDLMQCLPPTEQKSALDYICYLVTQYGDGQPKHKGVIEDKTSPNTETISRGADTFTDNESLNQLDAGKFSDIFGIIKTNKRVTLEEMDEAIKQRACENHLVSKQDSKNRQAIATQLIGCMTGTKIDDTRQAYHQYLENKYAKYL